jgi:vacuolar-type H+-ATPase subunit F/Vma7
VTAVARVAVIGAEVLVAGYGLAGAVVVPAEDDEAVRHAWAALPHDVEVVVLTPSAARALGPARTCDDLPLTVVMPT